MNRSIATRTLRLASDLADALIALGYSAVCTHDSKGRPVVLTNASEFALISVGA